MHASIWRFRGDPDELLRGYESMVDEIPAQNMRLHLCLSAPDGILLVDTCPREVFEGFVDGTFSEVCKRHGLPEPERARLYRHALRYWEVHRHRMAPEVALPLVVDGQRLQVLA